MSQTVEMRDASISRLFEHAVKNRDIIFLAMDFGAPSLDRFKNDLPGQFINVGISEQSAISIAAGLSLSGKRVYLYSIASFITLRCFEQLKLDISAMRLPITIIGVGTCYSYCFDGPTHQATEDITIMRTLPHFAIFSPSDAELASSLMDETIQSSQPIYLRLERGRLPVFGGEIPSIENGFRILREGSDIALISTGIMVHRAMKVAEELAKISISVKLIDIFRLKPLDSPAILEAVKTCKKIATLEEHTNQGGLGGIIAEIMVENGLFLPVKRFAIPDGQLTAYGSRERLHMERGLDQESLIETLSNWH